MDGSYVNSDDFNRMKVRCEILILDEIEMDLEHGNYSENANYLKGECR